ncbi:MAG: class I SAM-dependent methyltransferase [Alphaproteobacteria bacterium]|nr:class I SAM-dependent methyltransferase [Alphaproteobacteria bacterium]
MTKSEAEFLNFYAGKDPVHLYPTEFVIRAFLGAYPNLKLDKASYKNSRILDLGYGDGRNMPLMHNLGFKISGIEISEQLNELVIKRLHQMGIRADLRHGTNRHIPFEDDFFDYVLACHACYYVEEGSRFTDNLKEISRVSRSGAMLIASLPKPDTYILKDSVAVDDGHYRITHDPFGLRSGVILRAFHDEDEIRKEFSPFYENLSIGHCDDNYWGIHQKLWIIAGSRK